MNMLNLCNLDQAESRSISAENPTGAKAGGARATEGFASGPARELGQGWKMNPAVALAPGQVMTLADIEGPGTIEQIWMTPTGNNRFTVLRLYWDDQEHPSVECPIGDFFASGWGPFAQINSLPICVNPGNAFNCYWPMPFRERCRMTIENQDDEEMVLYYQINYSLGPVDPAAAYFHAQFRRVNPLPYKEVYTILDGVEGAGRYVGTYMAWGSNNNDWWGEGEIKFYLDGDHEFPTICGTGTEDYFCGSYNFEDKDTKQYREFSTPYAGLPQIIRPDGLYASQTRFGLYRWHITDPIRFSENLRVTIQALGWRSKRRYLPLQDDLASVAFWYQTLPTSPFADFPGKDLREII